jgi:hypothetical protein
MYDKSLKRKNEELSGMDSTAEDAENINVLIVLLKNKRQRVLDSLKALP